MESKRFDRLTRALAAGAPRRRVLAGVGAAVLAATGRAKIHGAAAVSATQAVSCSLSVVATIRLGPSTDSDFGGTEDGELRGDLEFAIGELGAINEATFRLADGTELAVVGQAIGRALHLRIEAGIDQALVLVGTARQDLGFCDGPIGGVLTGPRPGDLGDWSATVSATTPAESTGTAGGASAPPASAPPAPPPGPAGCPAGQIACAGVCVNTLFDPTNCGACGVVCGLGTDCCGGVCIATETDPTNCGSCGTVCPSGVCVAGACTPAPPPDSL